MAWPTRRMNRLLLCLHGLGGVVLTGCQTAPGPPQTESVTASDVVAQKEASERCALSRKPLSAEPALRLFAGEQIQFRSESEATTFDDLPGERKRVIAGQQVLARKGVANEDCPVSQDPLPIDATVISYEGVRLGFVSPEQTERFQGLPRDVQIRMVARYLLRSQGIPNDRCPISDLVLLPGSPTLQVADVQIAFANEASLETYQTMNAPQQNEIAASILLPERGITNTTCPITGKPVRLDSPVVMLDGQRIALRNVQAARAFNGMPEAKQRAMVFDEDF